jgi:protein-disulfide isomerase
MRRFYLHFVLGAAVLMPATVLSARAELPKPCVGLDSATTASIATYVAAKYHAGTTHDLSLKSSTQANDDCYWKLEYEKLSPRRTITVYLSPDHKYLLPALFDRNADPLAEERREREESARLLAGVHSASIGPKDASVTIVEFSDFQCPFCQRLATLMEKEVLPSEPNVHVVFRNFPLPMHPWAKQAAEVLACAQMQSDSAFWQLHDYVFNNQRAFTAANATEKLTAAADTQPGLNHDTFHQCIDEGFAVGPVAKDVELGNKYGVHATPTLFINGTKVEGVRDAAQLKQLIAEARAGTLTSGASEVATAEPTGSMEKPSAANAAACKPAR